MVQCIFRKKSPSFSPVSFEVLIPCDDVCWNAATKDDCLRQLKQMPRQIRISTALSYLSADGGWTGSILEVSSFGMLALILSGFAAFLSIQSEADLNQAFIAYCSSRS